MLNLNGAYHELFIEKDEYRSVAVSETLDFISAHSSGKPNNSDLYTSKTIEFEFPEVPRGLIKTLDNSSNLPTSVGIALGLLALTVAMQRKMGWKLWG